MAASDLPGPSSPGPTSAGSAVPGAGPAAPGAVDLGRVETASFGRRAAALLIDWALCTAVASLFVADLRVNPWPQLEVFVVMNTVFIGFFGRTPGMGLVRLRCVSIVDGGAIGLIRGLVRAVLLALFIPAMISDGDGRGLHDRAAKSVVVGR